MVYQWLNFAQSLLLPPRCLLCGADAGGGHDLCCHCAAALPMATPSCPRCALPLAVDGGAVPCGRCLRRSPPYERAVAAFRYADPVDRLVHGLKFSGRLSHARLLGELLAERIAADGAVLPAALVPVPLHPRRLRERGFNQALELARPLARRFGLPLRHAVVRRIRDTAAQSGLAQRARRGNVRGAFSVSAVLPEDDVAIVDDVVTTGATVDALAVALRRAGARRVTVWCVARAGVE